MVPHEERRSDASDGDESAEQTIVLDDGGLLDEADLFEEAALRDWMERYSATGAGGRMNGRGAARCTTADRRAPNGPWPRSRC
jgi:hypothetical protein